MKKCSEGCVEACDFCIYYMFNGDNSGVYTGDGFCTRLKMKADPGSCCSEFHCRIRKFEDLMSYAGDWDGDIVYDPEIGKRYYIDRSRGIVREIDEEELKMKDDIRRNGSGYYDPTASVAITKTNKSMFSNKSPLVTIAVNVASFKQAHLRMREIADFLKDHSIQIKNVNKHALTITTDKFGIRIYPINRADGITGLRADAAFDFWLKDYEYITSRSHRRNGYTAKLYDYILKLEEEINT